MRNSWKLGACAALVTSVAFIGCSDDDDDSDNGGGSGGSSSGSGGQAMGGSKAGGNNGGNPSAGKGGVGGTPAAGSGGKGGVGGSAGGAEMGGEGGMPVIGAAGAGGDAGVECTDEELGAGGAGEGGAGGAAGVTSAVVLIDNVVVAGAATLKEWQFDDDTTISDLTTYPADKWSRIVFDPGSLGDDAGAHATFLGCDGNPDDGSLKAVVPFADIDQYFELGCPFAAVDFSNTTITARVKLVSGGKPDAACPVRGEIYITGPDPAVPAGPAVALSEGQWVTLTLVLGAGAAGADRVGIRLNTYGC